MEASERKSDFRMYEPHLKNMIEIKKQIAEKIGYEKHPYNALLDAFEEELTIDDLDKVFGVLTPQVQKVLKKLVDSGSPFCGRAILENQSMTFKKLISSIVKF